MATLLTVLDDTDGVSSTLMVSPVPQHVKEFLGGPLGPLVPVPDPAGAGHPS
jgi:hypothetical protein